MQMFSQLGVLAGYELNKDYIASVLCVNRDKPEMHCDGKCYLKKKLQQDQQRKNSENGTMGSKIDIPLYCTDEQAPFLTVLNATTYTYPHVISYSYNSPYFSFFHPPRM